jgi:hypothetical protein
MAVIYQGKEFTVVKCSVTLTEQESARLGNLVSAGKSTARRIVDHRILLLIAERAHRYCQSAAQIINALGVGSSTSHRAWEWFVEDELEAVLVPRKMPR